MTDLKKTKCPNCQSTYPVPMEQLNNDSAKARCPKCTTVFFINTHLLQEQPQPTISDLNDFDIDFNSQHSNIQNTPSSILDDQEASANQFASGDDVFDSIASELSDPSSQKHANNFDNVFDSVGNNSEDMLGSLDDMSDWIAQQAQVIHQEKMQEQGLASETTGIETTTSSDDDWNENPVDPSQEPKPLNSIDNTQTTMLKNTPNNNSSNTEFSEDTQETTNSPELNELLNNYGVRTEVAKEEVKEDRLEKMRERSKNIKPTAQQEALKKSPLTFLLWLIGCLLLIALLFAQYAIFNVNQLIKNPEHRNKLISACNVLSCSLPGTDLQSYVISNLKHSPSKENSAETHTDIVAGINNISNQAQLYPNLRVTINGESGKLGEFIATPTDYLTVEQEQLAAQQGKLFMFTVKLNDAEVSSISIEPFY